MLPSGGHRGSGDNPADMKRLLALLIAVLLPLQLSWAVAATYCEHETTAQGAQHFGHHAHVHADAKPAGLGKLAADLDCSFCHAGSVASLPGLEAPPLAALRADVPRSLGDAKRPSAPQRTPDRPQWPRLA